MTLVHPAGCIAIGARAILVEGAPGAGKSELALAMIDRGALLVGDDGVSLERKGDRIYASPPPNTRGLIEVRNLGVIELPTGSEVPVALVLRLAPDAPRFVEEAGTETILGVELPALALSPHDAIGAIKAEMALDRFGLSFG
ncbi:HPr kinase [Novosphingobium marinum]|uniref:Serine kinase of HPr protein (Carbohydrate metabolism regulator) n=1 Tax=Novosphingobium marinum TaxID=1514948 RepID=A0A7Y9XWK8_9SPHN|nr:HPr kinase/phosphatase C-terminal domain-containing protein [Novosphingobium marinum]NYH94426.1 serine kinase of HPr protein (carbohydrate metabolism regulator) [Novosphingobium marinum]GGC22236.1 HPr kinase [Novosphingobium marinum]